MTKEERDHLIALHEESFAHFLAAKSAGAGYQEVEQLKRVFVDVRRAYYEQLPRVPMSRCPICNEVLRLSFDPWGVDGFWWQEKLPGDHAEPQPCPHFGLLQGAVNLNGQLPLGHPRVESFVGPAVPFVIPRVLQQRPVLAVISSIEMLNGYTAYPIVYYKGHDLPAGSFTQSWTRARYSFSDGRGGFPWRVDTDPWDFELTPWIERGKVVWIAPGDPDLQPRSHQDGPCPYAGLPGARERQYISDGRLWTRPAPAGEEIAPFAE
jgi:hypothetical protein